jgi:hypothetical protein
VVNPTFASAAAAYMKAGRERRYLTPLIEHFGNEPLSHIDQAAIDAAAEQIYPDGTAATRNRQAYPPFSAVLRHAVVERMLKRPKGSAGVACGSGAHVHPSDGIGQVIGGFRSVSSTHARTGSSRQADRNMLF